MPHALGLNSASASCDYTPMHMSWLWQGLLSGYAICTEKFFWIQYYQLAEGIKVMLRQPVFLGHLFHGISRKCKKKSKREDWWSILLIFPVLCAVTGSRNFMWELGLTRDWDLNIQFWPHRVLCFYQSGNFSNETQRSHATYWKQVCSPSRLSYFFKYIG